MTDLHINPRILQRPEIGTLPDHLWRKYIELCLLSVAYSWDDPFNDDTGSLPIASEIAWHLHVSHKEMQEILSSLEFISLVSKADDTGAWWQVHSSPEITLDYQNEYSSSWHKLREEILDRDKYRCVYCGASANTVDHIIPRSARGQNRYDNLVCACKSCNSSKGTKVVFFWYKVQEFYTEERAEYISRVMNGRIEPMSGVNNEQ